MIGRMVLVALLWSVATLAMAQAHERRATRTTRARTFARVYCWCAKAPTKLLWWSSSGHMSSLPTIAFCSTSETALQLNEYLAAIDAFEAYLTQGGSRIETERRAAVEQNLVELKKRVATLTITVDAEGATVSIDGRRVGTSPLAGPITLNVGRHQVSATGTDGSTANQELELAGGDARAVRLKLPTAARPGPVTDDSLASGSATPEKQGRARGTRIGIGLLASGGALGVGAVITGFLAKSAHDWQQSELDELRGDAEAIASASDDMKTYAITTDVLAGSAAALAITGLVLVLASATTSAPRLRSCRSEPLPIALLFPDGSNCGGAFLSIRCLLGALAVCSGLEGGCTVLYADAADEKQCQTDDDCESRAEEGTTLLCNVKLGVCEFPGDTRYECKQNQDCPSNLLCGFDGICYEKWGCLDDDPDWPTAVANFEYSGSLVSLQNPQDPSLLGNSLEVLACSGGDPDCTRPLVTGKVDGSKNVSLRFEDFKESQFSGFIRILDKRDPAEAFMPAYIHYGSDTRLVSDLPVQTRIFMVDPMTYQGLAMLAGADADLKAGTMIFVVQDCGGRGAAGVAMKPVGLSSYKFIAVQGGNQPVPDATSTGVDGAGLFVNMPPDEARTFVLTNEESGQVIDEVSINVRGGATNYVFYYPRYAALQRLFRSRSASTIEGTRTFRACRFVWADVRVHSFARKF